MSERSLAWEEPCRTFVGPGGEIDHFFEAPIEQRVSDQVRRAGLYVKTIVITTAEGRWIGRAIVGRSIRLESLPVRDLRYLLEEARKFG